MDTQNGSAATVDAPMVTHPELVELQEAIMPLRDKLARGRELEPAEIETLASATRQAEEIALRLAGDVAGALRQESADREIEDLTTTKRTLESIFAEKDAERAAQAEADRKRFADLRAAEEAEAARRREKDPHEVRNGAMEALRVIAREIACHRLEVCPPGFAALVSIVADDAVE